MASLRVNRGDDGRVLLHCHAGCTVEAVCAAIGLSVGDLFDEQNVRSSRRGNGSERGRIVTTYDYCDRDGRLLYQTVRFDPKDFRQRRPDGQGGWRWNLKGVGRVLYRLPDLLAAEPSVPAFVVEGEKDADNLVDRGLLATTCPMGAGKWKHLSDDAPLHGRSVYIVSDADEAGRKHANDVAKRLCGKAAEVRIVELPGHGKDASDWLAAGGTAARLLELAAKAPLFEPEPPKCENAECSDGNGRPSQATTLVRLCENVEFFHDDDVAYASVQFGSGLETLPVRSRAFRRWLARRFFLAEGKAPGGQAAADAVAVLEGQALFEGPQIKAHVRLAERDAAIYVDLADEARRIVRITAAGWDVVPEAPVRFRRPRGMLALPAPARGGSIEDLRRFINVERDQDLVLLVGWMLATYRLDRPMPILVLVSEQGSGKSTATRLVRLLLDPNEAPIRTVPSSARDLAIAASNSRIIALDNLSSIPVWLSDALCRLSTGGGFATRELFENDQETIFNALRPVVVNGIEEMGARSDFLDRTIRISLPSIPEDRRKSEEELYAEFDDARPALLGALFDVVSTALRRHTGVRLNRLPRMADMARWIVAAEEALPWPGGAFMEAYGGNRESAHDLALESSPLSDPVRRFAAAKGEWTGAATELLKQLNDLVDEETQRGRAWPKHPHVLSGVLRRLAPNLRAVGVRIEFPKPGHHGRVLTIGTLARNSVASAAERCEADPECGTALCRDVHRPDRDAPATASDVPETAAATQCGARDARLPHRSNRPPAFDDDAEERAAIMEFDGGLSRAAAERAAGVSSANGQLTELTEERP